MLDTWKDKDTRSIPHSTNGTFCTCLQYRMLIHNCMSLTVRHSLWRERIKQKSYVETTLARPTVCWLTLLDFVGINKFLPLPFTFTVNLAEIWWMRYTYIHTCIQIYIYTRNAAEHLSFKKSAQGCKCTYIAVCTVPWYHVILTKYVPPWHSTHTMSQSMPFAILL